MSKQPKSKTHLNSQGQLDLPPQIPGTTEDLQRVILLLGNRTKADLTTKTKRELIALIAAYPTSEQAATWKQNLKQLVKVKLSEAETSPQIVKIISNN